MNKRRLHHLWATIRDLKPWYFLVPAVISSGIFVFAMRANNLHMVQLREAVYVADKENGDIEGALRGLRVYVYGHMNTDLASGSNAVYPPIQLKYTYERLVKVQNSGTSANNNEIYAQAQKSCEQSIPDGFSGSYRLTCIQDFVKKNGFSTLQTVPSSLYKFDFISPSWSPDVAGWSLIATIFFALCALASFLFRYVIRYMLKS